jgi:hypothetical protein
MNLEEAKRLVSEKKRETSKINAAKARETRLIKQRAIRDEKVKKMQDDIIRRYEAGDTKLVDEQSSSEDEVIIFNPRKKKMTVEPKEKKENAEVAALRKQLEEMNTKISTPVQAPVKQTNPVEDELVLLRKQLTEMHTKLNAPINTHQPVHNHNAELAQHMKMKILNF